MLILDCDECQGASQCELSQKASGQPCPGVEPAHCGLTMRLQTTVLRASGPQISFLCVKCGAQGIAHTTRPQPEQRRSFVDPILSRISGRGIPDALE